MKVTDTFQIQDHDGKPIPLTADIRKTIGVAYQNSAIHQAVNTIQVDGNSNIPMKGLKKVKRTFGTITPKGTATNLNTFTNFVDASNGVFNTYQAEIEYHIDNIVIDNYDKMLVNKNYDWIAGQVSEYLVDIMEKDLAKLLAKALTEAQAANTYIAISTTGAPTGVQPAQTGANTAAGAITAIKGGRRSVVVTEAELSTADNAMKLVRTSIYYLNALGSPKSVEKDYAYAINGIALYDIVVLTNYEGSTKLNDAGMQTSFINVNDPKAVNAVVTKIDRYVDVVVTNQLPLKVVYAISSKRAMERTIVRSQAGHYLGEVTKADMIVSNGVAKEAAPSTYKLKLMYPTSTATPYAGQETIWILNP